MEEIALQFKTYYEQQREIVNRFIQIRKNKKISQRRLATLSGVSYGSIRRFENTGEISLTSFIKLALGMQLYDDLDNLFKRKNTYTSIEEIINDQKD